MPSKCVLLAALLCPLVAQAAPVIPHPAYSLSEVAQRRMPVHTDIMPNDPASRENWAAAIAYDAAIYGTAPVLQYRQMHNQAVDRTNIAFTGFNTFRHDRELAGPGYKPFKTPNADTLYSNAWLDLSQGPVVLTVPDMKDNYFTVNFLDMYGNASNIGARTRGFGPGKYLLVPAGWSGNVPAGMEKFVLATPYTWILMRILAANPSDLSAARGFQDGFRLDASPSVQAAVFPPSENKSAAGFFKILDWSLCANGYPFEETALIQRYRLIGIGGGSQTIDGALADPAIARGMARGLKQARDLIAGSASQSGYPAGHWKMPADTGAWGYNYLYRAVISTLGTGANIMEENYPFNTFQDADGKPLDGSTGRYQLSLSPPPPARFFWSVTMYDARTKELTPNAIARYVIGDRTKGVVRDAAGNITIDIQADRPKPGSDANWLPAPSGPFYLVIRAQGPKDVLLNGQWQPRAVEKVAGK